MELQGKIDPNYSLIATAFLDNFKYYDEIGASLCVYHNNKLVIDIFSGYKNVKKQELWEENTVVPFFSTTKVIAASCLAICHSRGLFDYNDKVSKYWEDFAENGKEDITIAQLLQHRGGLSAIDRKLTIELIKDRQLLEKIIAGQKPHWNPGDFQGYHCWTIGWYISALLSKIDTKKRRLKEFVEEEILPNIIGEIRVGIDDSFDFSRIAILKPVSKTKGIFTMPFKFVKEFFNPWSLTFKTMLNPTFVGNHANFNRRDVLELEFGSGGGIGNAKGVASLFNGLTNPNNPLFLGKNTLDYLIQYPIAPPINGFEDLVFKQKAFIFHAGFMKPSDQHNFSLNRSAFGGFGAGGSFVISDSENKLTFAYTMNNMSHDMMNMKREVQIREAVYKTIANTR
jgi:CubicO group peptidase (beta-lactamase class C family)